MSKIGMDEKHRGPYRRHALTAAITLALMTSGPTLAAPQTTNDSDATNSQSQQSSDARKAERRPGEGSSQEQADEDSLGLGDITVTATGRGQRLTDVPYNITAVSGRDIERNRTQDNAELFRSIPGVNVVDSGPRNSGVVNSIRIRGVNVDSSALGDYALTSVAPVATYIDSVPLFANFLLFDIDRVEVLKGPQGTLYGSGSLGGTVRYLLRKPDFSGFHGSVSASLSKTDESSSIGNSESFMLNVPLGNTAAVRINGMHNDYPGVTDYVNIYKLDDNGRPLAPDGILARTAEYETRKDADSVRQDYGRISLFWMPTDRFDLQLTHLAQSDDFGARRGTSFGSDGFGRSYERGEMGAVQLEPSKRHARLTSLEANLDLGFATLTSSTSHYNHEGDITSDNTGFYAQNGWYTDFYYNYPRPMSTAERSYGDKAFMQELRLVSETGGDFDYIVGAWYQNQETHTAQDSFLIGFKDWWDAAFPAASGSVVDDNDLHYYSEGEYRETALYGQGTWHATDSLQFTLGVRSFRDRYTADQIQDASPWTHLRDLTESHDTQKSNKTLLLGNMSWHFNADNLLYATISEGYRRGGANASPVTGYFAEDPAWQFYEADTITNTEVGIKGAGKGFSYTADVFLSKWKDPQINTSTTNWGFFAVGNMGRAESKGVEVEFQGRTDNGFSYGLGYAYTDAKLTRDARAADGSYLISPKGARLPGVSEHRINVSGDYTRALGGGLMTLHIDGSYQSDSENALSVSPLFEYTLPSFSIWNAVASYSRDQWMASLWVKNITNTRGITGVYTEEYMGTDPSQGFYGNGSKMITTLSRTLGASVTWWF